MKPGNSSQKLLSIQAVLTVLWNPDRYTECSDASMMPITSIPQMPDNCLVKVGHRRKRRRIWLISSDEDTSPNPLQRIQRTGKSQKGNVNVPQQPCFSALFTHYQNLASRMHSFVWYSVIPETNAVTLCELCESFCWHIKMKALITTYVIHMVRNAY